MEADAGVLADVDTGCSDDALQAGLLELTTRAEINGRRTDLGEQRGDTVVLPVDVAFESGRAFVGCDRLGDLSNKTGLGVSDLFPD